MNNPEAMLNKVKGKRYVSTIDLIMIMIMTSGWGLQQRPTSPIIKKYNTPKIKMDNEAVHELSQNVK